MAGDEIHLFSSKHWAMIVLFLDGEVYLSMWLVYKSNSKF